jgi:hypothetical protein
MLQLKQQYETYKALPLNTRKADLQRCRDKYPEKIPVLLTTRLDNQWSGLRLREQMSSKHKFLVPREMPVARFVSIIRQRYVLPPEMALFLMINGEIPPMSHVLGEHPYIRDDDGFLTVILISENAFG